MVSYGMMQRSYPPWSAIPSAPRMMWAVSGGCLSSDAQIAFSAVWEPTIETNQRPSVRSSRAKASTVAENPPAEMVNRSSGSMVCVWNMSSLLSFLGVGDAGAGGCPPREAPVGVDAVALR